MNKNIPTTDIWRISEMASHIPAELVSRVEPHGDEAISPSADRIKQLAIQKRQDYFNKDYFNGNEGKPMKKVSFRVLLIAAIITVMSVTAFAASGGLDFIKGIFGDSAESIENEIVTPSVTAAADGREMALEAMVTDGYITNLVVSITGKEPAQTELFTVASDIDIRSSGWYILQGFTTKTKTYFVVDLVSEQRFETADITISLNRDVAAIDLSFQIENRLGNAVVDFPAGTMSGQTQLRELQVSPMGFMLIGNEENAQGGLPATNIRVVFSNGKTEDLEVEFAPSDDTVTGGGGAVISARPQNAPLVITFHGTRNTDGELVISGQFSRIINPAAIEKVIIDGVEYQVN